MKVTIEKDEIVIRAPIKPAPSKSGESTLLASTRGTLLTSTEYKGQQIKLSFNAYVPAA